MGIKMGIIRFFYPLRVWAKVSCFGIFGLACLSFFLFIGPFFRIFIRNDEKRNLIYRRINKGWFTIFTQIMTLGTTIKVEWNDPKNLMANCEGKMVISNHPSLIDVIIIGSRINRMDCIVKEYVFRYPFVRFVVGKLFISNGLENDEFFGACESSLKKGNTLLVFPEGTRTKPGREVKYQRGAAHIALRSGSETIPIRIESNGAIGLRKGDPMFFHRKDGPIRYYVNVLDPIQLDEYREESPVIAARKLTEKYKDLTGVEFDETT